MAGLVIAPAVAEATGLSYGSSLAATEAALTFGGYKLGKGITDWFFSRKKQKTSKPLWTGSKLEKRGSKKLYKDSDEMPKYGRKSRKSGGKGGTYQGKRVPGRNSYIKRGSAPGIKAYKKKVRTKSAKRGGSSRLFDMVAPPLTIYNREFIPRQLTKFGLKDTTLYDSTSGKMLDTLTGSGYYPSWSMFPILTTREALTYLLKCINTPHALAWNYHHHHHDGTDEGANGVHTTLNDVPAEEGDIYPASADILVPANLSITNVYGTMEGFKMSYTLGNSNECSVWVTIYECRPRDPVDGISVPLTDNNVSGVTSEADSKVLNVNVNPLALIEYDHNRKQAKRQTRYANHSTTNDERFPKGVDLSYTSDDWKLTSDITGGREFNKHYVCLQKKTICLKPGERFQYDVVVPGFGMRFDKYLKYAQAKNDDEGTSKVPLAELQSTFTRFLLIKHRSVRMYKLQPQSTAGDSQLITPTWPIDGKTAYLADCKLSIRASKYLRARLLPRTEKRIGLRTGGDQDIDCFGQMPTYHGDSELESDKVATWNGRNIFQVNRYPNMQMVVGSSVTGGQNINQGSGSNNNNNSSGGTNSGGGSVPTPQQTGVFATDYPNAAADLNQVMSDEASGQLYDVNQRSLMASDISNNDTDIASNATAISANAAAIASLQTAAPNSHFHSVPAHNHVVANHDHNFNHNHQVYQVVNGQLTATQIGSAQIPTDPNSNVVNSSILVDTDSAGAANLTTGTYQTSGPAGSTAIGHSHGPADIPHTHNTSMNNHNHQTSGAWSTGPQTVTNYPTGGPQ